MKNYKEEFVKEQEELISRLVDDYWKMINSLDLSLEEWLDSYKNIDFSWINTTLKDKINQKIISLSPYKIGDLVQYTKLFKHEGKRDKPYISPVYEIKEIVIINYANEHHLNYLVVRKDSSWEEGSEFKSLADMENESVKITWTKV